MGGATLARCRSDGACAGSDVEGYKDAVPTALSWLGESEAMGHWVCQVLGPGLRNGL